MSGKRWLTPTLRRDLWRRFREGETITDIAAALDVQMTAISACVSRSGGIEPSAVRRKDALTELEREEISRGIAVGMTVRSIARCLRRSPSTISREIRRNAPHRSRYRAASAERYAFIRARRPKVCKLARYRRLRGLVAAKLKLEWSPQQIAGWLRATFPTNPAMRVSHETIYKTLFVQARGALKKELTAHLRTGRSRREPQRQAAANTASVVDGISIRERPAEVEDRAVPGHWEGDLLFGTVNTYIVTLVERSTRFCLLAKISSKDTKHVSAAIQKQICRLPAELRRSLTWDRGSELSGHADFTVETGIPVYFCDPRSPWQRGSNENTNGLLRQYFPNGKDISVHSQAELNRVARRLNGRPRMTLNWKSPAQALNELLR